MKKFHIEDYLHSIDVAFANKSKKDIYMIYFMIFAGIFAFSYLFFWETSFQSFEDKLHRIAKVKKKINADQKYLRHNPPVIITKLDKQIKAAQEDFIKYQDYNQYVESKIETISFLLYDEGVWGDFINSIDLKAKSYGITLLELSNKLNDSNASFGHVMDISLHTKGEYKNVLKFLNSLEESQLVVDVHDLNISANDFLESKINISVWGIRF